MMREKRALAEAIDRALLRLAPADLQHALELSRREDATRAADRVQLRAKRLAKAQAARRCHILAAADELVLRLYLAAAPAGSLCGWCDASVSRDGSLARAGVGSVLLDDRGREIARISRPIAGREVFEAEIAALEAALRAAAAHGGRAPRIRLYTDCGALVSLWLQRRSAPRLRTVRELARRFGRFELRSVPRRHNRLAHQLAREAALTAPRRAVNGVPAAPGTALARSPGRASSAQRRSH